MKGRGRLAPGRAEVGLQTPPVASVAVPVAVERLEHGRSVRPWVARCHEEHEATPVEQSGVGGHEGGRGLQIDAHGSIMPPDEPHVLHSPAGGGPGSVSAVGPGALPGMCVHPRPGTLAPGGDDMRETAEDLVALDGLLDESYAAAGDHLREIHTDEARLSAAELADRLAGMQVLVVATVTGDGRPLTGPVDSFLYRGRLYFGSSPTSVRARHLDRNPAVSATHVRGEELVVTVHGTAWLLDLDGTDSGFADLCRDHYGEGWDDWGGAGPYWAIEPDRMFAADMSVHAAG